jgi:hypothetical protein
MSWRLRGARDMRKAGRCYCEEIVMGKWQSFLEERGSRGSSMLATRRLHGARSHLHTSTAECCCCCYCYRSSCHLVETRELGLRLEWESHFRRPLCLLVCWLHKGADSAHLQGYQVGSRFILSRLRSEFAQQRLGPGRLSTSDSAFKRHMGCCCHSVGC